MMKNQGLGSELHATRDYLRLIGVPEIRPRIHPFDPGYDPGTTISHLDQSWRMMASFKISMACWMIADEQCSREKIRAANRYRVPVVTGGGPFEVAVACGQLDAYLTLCASMGVSCIEAGEGFTDMPLAPELVMAKAKALGLDVQFEMGKKHHGEFTEKVVGELIDQGKSWLGAGVTHLVVEGRESANEVGLFDERGQLNKKAADRFARAFGLDVIVFEAPTKASQFALLRHFGLDVQLSNVRLEEILRVEIFRRGLHSDAFDIDRFTVAREIPAAETV